MTSPRCPSKSAFTLVELLAVMGMLALLFTIIVSSLSGGGEGQNLRIAATELRSALRYARQHAIANSTTCSVIFAYDPELAEDAGTFKRPELYAEGRSPIKTFSRERYMRAYAVYSKRAEGNTNDGRITPWKSLPQGMVFDAEQNRGQTSGRLNALTSAECRTDVMNYAYSEVAAGVGNKILGPVQAVTFRSDGTVKYYLGQSATSMPTIFITEGATNGADSYDKPLKCTYRVPDKDERNYVALVVPSFSGDPIMSMKANLRIAEVE